MQATVQEADWVLRVRRLCRAALEGPLQLACERVDEAFVVIDRDGDETHPVFAELLCTTADASLALQQLDAADELYRRAERVAAWLGSPILRARALEGQATIEVHRERNDRARLRLAEALQVLRRCDDDDALPARLHIEAWLRRLDTPNDLHLDGYGTRIRVAPDAEVVREDESLYAEASGSDGLHAGVVDVDDGRIVRIAESHDGPGTLRIVGPGPRSAEWTVRSRGFTCAWPAGTTLRAHVRMDSSFEIATEHGQLLIRGPFVQDDLPELEQLRAPRQRVVLEGNVAHASFIDLEYVEGEQTWRQRLARIDDTLCLLVTAQAPVEHFEACVTAMQELVESLRCA